MNLRPINCQLPKLTFLIDKFEYLMLLLFISISILFFMQKYFSYIFISISAFIGCFLFIVLHKNTETDIESFQNLNKNSITPTLIISSIYFLFFALSLFEITRGFYTKTIHYYFFISICAGSIATEIFFINTEKQAYFNLIKSFLLILNITLSNQLVYPLGIGLSDLPIHLDLIYEIISKSHIPYGIKYQYFPCHHILVAMSVLVSNLDPKMTYLYLGGFLICFGVFFVFILGRKFESLKFALFAALIYTCLDYLVMYGSHPIHQSYIYFYSIIFFTLILFIHQNRHVGFLISYLIITTTMVFTHHLSALINLIVITSFIINEIVSFGYKKIYYRSEYFSLIRLFIMVLFAQWIYYSNLMGLFVGFLKIYGSAISHSSENLISATSYDQISIDAIFLNTLGSSILVLFSIMGFLSFLKKPSFFHKSIISSSISVAILLIIGILFKYAGLLPDRLYPFLQLFGLVFLASESVCWISNLNIKSKANLKIFIVLLITSLSFFSCSSTIAGIETSPFLGNEISYAKLYETGPEIAFENWRLYSSPNYCIVSQNPPLTNDGHFDLVNVSQNSFVTLNKFYFITGFTQKTGDHLGQRKFFRVPYEETSKFESFNEYYDNNMLELYYAFK